MLPYACAFPEPRPVRLSAFFMPLQVLLSLSSISKSASCGRLITPNVPLGSAGAGGAGGRAARGWGRRCNEGLPVRYHYELVRFRWRQLFDSPNQALSQRVLFDVVALQILWWFGSLDRELPKARKGEDVLCSWCWANEGLHFRSLWYGRVWRRDVTAASTSCSVVHYTYCTISSMLRLLSSILAVFLPRPPLSPA